MGQAKVEPFRIVLKPGVEPIYRKQWRLADYENKFIDEESTKMPGLNVVGPSMSPRCFPITLASKNDDYGNPVALRFCTDFRALNDVN